MNDLTKKVIIDHIETVLPRTCEGMATRLQAWLEVASKSHSETALLESDGSMDGDLFAKRELAVALQHNLEVFVEKEVE